MYLLGGFSLIMYLLGGLLQIKKHRKGVFFIWNRQAENPVKI